MNKKTISRQELLGRLQRVAQVRSVLTMLSVLPILFVAFAVFGESMGGGSGGMAAVSFGGPLVVMVLITQFYCKRAVKCPHCGSSLWHCGTGNFKPRRMRIRKEAEGCLQCHGSLT